MQLEADKFYFEASLAKADAIVNGRHSQEGHPDCAKRRRLVVTRQVDGVAPDPDNFHAWRWNPAGASLETALGKLGLSAGTVAIIGGPQVYTLFLKLGYDVFHLSRARKVRLPGGLPVFTRETAGGGEPQAALTAAGFRPGPTRLLDDEVSCTDWTPRG
jgi:hypothetical protein